ncbi:site-specific recombinase XerD [Chitinophaga skermanii]|uniref:Site-specific recombinase XerD n=1 Tax=Chitinophaga skermanii TaxID=331697 RepID=A0A327QHQ0_9BACT|nr:site-specific integrase [Chitinophaga skermanii]RAJ04079.1 site-specific recombinase XerD [Chitinophaga skermanii]
MEGTRIFISFFLYKSRKTTKGIIPIFARISYEGKRLNHNTGLFIDEKSWDGKKYLVKGNKPESLEINKSLAALKTRILQIHNNLNEQEISISIEVIKQRLAGKDIEKKTLLEAFTYHDNLLLKDVGTKNSRATLTKYRTLQNKVTKYIQQYYKRKDIFLKELNHEFVVNFEIYLKVTEQIIHNPAIKYIQHLKKIVNLSIAHSWITVNPFRNFKCSIKAVERGYLTNEDLSKIEAKHISNARLCRVRDIFLFSCYTGLAYADVSQLKPANIVTGVDGEKWINTFRQKTNVRTSVPLLPKALSILTPYLENAAAEIFPIISNQKINAYLKEIGDICDISKKLTFHLARHTFATTITLSNGVPIESVSKLLGHTNLKTTQVYAKVVDTKISQDMQQLKSILSDKTQLDK